MANPGWSRAAGTYVVSVGEDARTMVASEEIALPASHLSPHWRPQ